MTAAPSFAQTALLAGYFAAHAVWSIADGDRLVPFIGYEARKHRRIVRFDVPEYDVAVRAGLHWMSDNPYHATRAAMVHDACKLHASRGRQVLVVAARDFEAACAFEIVVPYRPVRSIFGFAVHRPTFAVGDDTQGALDAIAGAFASGVRAHEKGASIWNAHFDPTR